MTVEIEKESSRRYTRRGPREPEDGRVLTMMAIRLRPDALAQARQAARRRNTSYAREIGLLVEEALAARAGAAVTSGDGAE